jgi:hypothetical protein
VVVVELASGRSAEQALSAACTVGLEVSNVVDGILDELVDPGDAVGRVTPWSFRQFL